MKHEHAYIQTNISFNTWSRGFQNGWQLTNDLDYSSTAASKSRTHPARSRGTASGSISSLVLYHIPHLGASTPVTTVKPQQQGR